MGARWPLVKMLDTVIHAIRDYSTILPRAHAIRTLVELAAHTHRLVLCQTLILG